MYVLQIAANKTIYANNIRMLVAQKRGRGVKLGSRIATKLYLGHD